MARRALIAGITLFFVTMNFLLWRSEISGRKALAVPPKMVWKRVLENEHKSNFEIRHHGIRLGSARWTSTIQIAPETLDNPIEDVPVEGMMRQRGGYTIDFDGTWQI